MWWKIYFWIFAVLTFLGMFVYLGLIPWNLASWIEVTSSILAVIGLYSYAFNKQIFNLLTWKIFFWISVLSLVAGLIYELSLKDTFQLPAFIESQQEYGTGTLIFGIIISLPVFYALYQLSQGKTASTTSKVKPTKKKKK